MSKLYSFVDMRLKEIIEKYESGLEIQKDSLTSKERCKLFSEHKPVDRIPCYIDGGETMAPLLNYSIDEYYHDSEKMVNVELYIHEKFGSDSVGLSTTLRGMAEAMGSKIKYSKDTVAQLEKPAIESYDAISFAKRVDIDKDGRLPIILNGLKILKEKLGDVVGIGGTVTGPFTVAAMVLGTERLLIGLRKAPKKIHELMEVIVENNNKYIERLIDIGVGIGFADPVSGNSILRLKDYEEFSLPYFKKNVDFIHSKGRNCGLHICGKSKALWEDIAKTGISAFSLDNVEDLEEVKNILGPYMEIQGNVPPVEVLRYGEPKDILLSAKECIRKAYNSKNGYTLTSGCQTPVNTSEENMMALMDGARIFGKWPLDLDLLNETFEDEYSGR